jgi:hypothetical protein
MKPVRAEARRSRRMALALVAALALPAVARAQSLDSVDLRTDQGVTEIHLQFTTPIQYLKHFPAERGQLLKVYLQGQNLDPGEERQLQEFKNAPRSLHLPLFTIFYTTGHGCYAVPNPLCLDIQFRKPVRYRVRQGTDGRSLILIVLPDAGTKPATSPSPAPTR